MNQIPRLVGHLEWLLSQSRKELRDSSLGLYNCATRIRLSSLDSEAWSIKDADRTRTRLRALIDALANAALRVYLDNRDTEQPNTTLTVMLITRARAVIEFARNAGFTITPKEHPASSTPPSLTEIWSVVSRLSTDSDAFPALPDQYVKEIAGGILDILAGAAHQSGSRKPSGISRTMNNTGAAAIELAQYDHDKAAIPGPLKQHDRLVAKVLRERAEGGGQ